MDTAVRRLEMCRYDLTAVRTDLARFTFLLGDDGEQLFGTDQT